MYYDEFEGRLKAALEEHLDTEVEVRPEKKIKNNGVIYHGLFF